MHHVWFLHYFDLDIIKNACCSIYTSKTFYSINDCFPLNVRLASTQKKTELNLAKYLELAQSLHLWLCIVQGSANCDCRFFCFAGRIPFKIKTCSCTAGLFFVGRSLPTSVVRGCYNKVYTYNFQNYIMVINDKRLPNSKC